MIKPRFRAVVIADEHFGVMDGYELYYQHSIILKYLRENYHDMIFIAGDYFDKELSLNDNSSGYAYKFMQELYELCEDSGCILRIIYGTESHEVNQYNAFKAFENRGVDFKVIKTVQEESFDDINILYLPEEYIYNKSEYYKEYFKNEKKYDYVIGHGVIQELMETASYHMGKSSTSNRLKVPIFNSNELNYICKGHVYFGHYHINTSINDNIFYVGSYSRWCHGEEEPKGFYHIEVVNDIYSNEFIINTLAKEYTTINYGYQSKIFKSNENLLDEFDKMEMNIKNGTVDNIRMVINIPDDHPDSEAMIQSINERIKDNKYLNVKITNGFVNKKQKINEEYLHEAKKSYGYLFDETVLEDKCSSYIKDKFEQEISSDRVKFHFTSDNILNNG